MKKLVLGLVIGGVLGGAVGFAMGIFFYPYIFLADIVATETIEDLDKKQVVATEMFVHVNPSDPIHYGSGGVTVYDNVVHLEKDFEVGPGPKFHVYLAPSDNVTTAADVKNSMFIDLGRLRAFKGSQNYSIPAGVKLNDYGSVVIWCEQFGVLVSPAKLNFQET